MKITMLGCGASHGVPSIARGWMACDPKNPKNARLRPSIFIEDQGVHILVDTTPDLRQQALRAGIQKVDAIIYTHTHADHTHGIDDVRGFFLHRGRQKIPAYGYPRDLEVLQHDFSYIFETPEGSMYQALLEAKPVTGAFNIEHLHIKPFEQDHGDVISMGFRINNFAYSTDVCNLSDDALEALIGLDVWIVDCLLYDPHPSHAHLGKVLEWVNQIQPKRTILTHMGVLVDYDEISAKLPKGVEPGYDGLEILL